MMGHYMPVEASYSPVAAFSAKSDTLGRGQHVKGLNRRSGGV